jgi:hypothetical protein
MVDFRFFALANCQLPITDFQRYFLRSHPEALPEYREGSFGNQQGSSTS